MTAPTWITPAGFLGTFTERVAVSIPLTATGTNIVYSVIAGALPIGISLNTATGVLLGTPVSVPVNINRNFVIRLKNSEGIDDRTFNMEIVGPSIPAWASNPGLLPVGINGEFYAINREYVDYTVRAETDVLVAGNTLKYYIADNQGQLPPGLTLTSNGRIYGYVNDSLALDGQASISGGYDNTAFDRYPYDYGNIQADTGVYLKPEYINKIYQFYVTVTDGIASSQRLFSIEVVDPNSLRVDNSLLRVDSNIIEADSGYLLPPIWQNQYGDLLPKIANLGTIRASQTQIITLHEYDPYPFVGPINWDWSITVNPEIKLVTDSQFDIYGNETQNIPGTRLIYFKNTSLLPVVGMHLRVDDYIPGFDPTNYTITSVVPTSSTTGYITIDRPLAQKIPDSTVLYVGSSSVHPNGLNLDSVSGELYGMIPYQPAFSQTYKFTISIIKTDNQTGLTVNNRQIFTLTIKGDIDSHIRFISTSSLGSLFPGQISELSVIAENIKSNYAIEYSLVRGKLPNGLTLYNDGSIQGKISYQTQTLFDFTITQSLTAFELDENNTTIDENWYFTVRANDVYKLSAIEQQFYITVNEDSVTQYTRIFVKPFLSADKRLAYSDFTSNSTIFDPSTIYRIDDPEFGVQPEIKMLIEPGIQQVGINHYVSATQSYFHRKKFYFGDVKSVPAQDANGNVVYELVYVEIVDDQMNGIHSPSTATSVANMQIQLEGIVINPNIPILVNDQLKPRYMSTIQASTGTPLGFVKAVPICYTLPGHSAKVLSRIQSNGFDFKDFNFDTDRIIIETPVETNQNGWIFYPTGKQ